MRKFIHSLAVALLIGSATFAPVKEVQASWWPWDWFDDGPGWGAKNCYLISI